MSSKKKSGNIFVHWSGTGFKFNFYGLGSPESLSRAWEMMFIRKYSSEDKNREGFGKGLRMGNQDKSK